MGGMASVPGPRCPIIDFQGFGQSNAMTFDCLSPQATAVTTLQGIYTDSNTSNIIGRTLNCRFVSTTSFIDIFYIK